MAPEDGHGAGEANQNTVFIDTSLDTHLATIVSDSDTVSDLKKRIMLEHRQCFPAIGDIEIHCLKVKRRGNYYHLSDSMLVKSAFGSSEKIWFLSLDASRLQQCDGIQRLDKHKARDQLGLPWVTDSLSTDRHNSHSDRPLMLSFVHGSPSMQHKMIPFVNQKVPNVDRFTSGDSCKDVSKNIEKDKSSNDNHCREQQLESIVEEKLYAVNKEKKSKKRTPDVHDESLREDAIGFGSGPSAKKRCKTQKTVSNAKASEEDWVLTNDTVANALNAGHTKNMVVGKKKVNRVNEGENSSAHDQVATVVPSTIEDVAEATHPQKNTQTGEVMHDTAMVVEKNIPIEMPFGMSQKDKENELVQKEVIGKIPSSSMRTSDCDHEDAGVTAGRPRKGAKRSTKHKTVEKELPSTPSIEKLHNSNKDVGYSQQDFGSHDHEFTGDQIDKCKETMVCENTDARKTRKSKKSTAKNKDKLLTKHAESILDGNSLMVPSPAVDEEKNDKVSLRNEDLEKTLVDNSLLYESKKGDDLVVKDVENSEPTESNRSRVRAEDVEDNASKKLKDNLESRRKKKDASRNGESVVRDTNEEKLLPRSECKEIPVKTLKDAFHAENSEPTESTKSRVHVEDMEEEASKILKDNLESRQNKKDDGRFTLRNDESVVRHTNEENLLPHSESKESPEKTLRDALHVDHGRNDANLVDGAVEKNISQVNAEGCKDNSEKQQNENTNGTKKSKKKKKKEIQKSSVEKEDETIVKHALDGHLHENAKEGEGSLPDANRKSVRKEKLDDVSEVGVGTDDGKPKRKDEQSFDDGLVKKVKNHKSSVRGRSNLPIKHQSTEVELESKSIELHPLHEEQLKNIVSDEVSNAKMERRDNVTNEVDTQKGDSHDIDFIPNKIASTDKVKDATLLVREQKPKKKTKEIQPREETSSDPRKKLVSSDNKVNKEQDDSMDENNQVLFSKNKTPEVSADVVKDPNIPNTDQVKTQKQQPITVKARAKTMKKSAPVVNSSQHVQSLLNTGTIFGDDSDMSSADDNAIADSGSSTTTPSGKSLSWVGPSIDSRRNESHGIKRKEGDGKNRVNSQSRYLLRSSSRFKKAKITASQHVEDIESEPVDFVPESTH